MEFKVGDKVKVVKTEPLEGNDVAPNLIMDSVLPIQKIVVDKGGNQHLDVGLVSSLNWVTSHETKEELPEGDKIHWCHPSRFVLAN